METKSPSPRLFGGDMRTNVRMLVTLAMLSAMAYLVMAVGRIPMVLFLKYEAKDVIIVIAGFLYGPAAAALISLVVSLVEMITVSDTGIIGCVMNVLSSCAFACTAAFLYKRGQTLKSAILGLALGCVLMTAVMLLWNYLITPIYMNVPRQDVVGMLVPVFLPFNLVKSGLNAALTMLLYKPVAGILRRSRLVPASVGGGNVKVGVFAVSALVLVTFILLALVLAGVL